MKKRKKFKKIFLSNILYSLSIAIFFFIGGIYIGLSDRDNFYSTMQVNSYKVYNKITNDKKEKEKEKYDSLFNQIDKEVSDKKKLQDQLEEAQIKIKEIELQKSKIELLAQKEQDKKLENRKGFSNIYIPEKIINKDKKTPFLFEMTQDATFYAKFNDYYNNPLSNVKIEFINPINNEIITQGISNSFGVLETQIVSFPKTIQNIKIHVYKPGWKVLQQDNEHFYKTEPVSKNYNLSLILKES